MIGGRICSFWKGVRPISFSLLTLLLLTKAPQWYLQQISTSIWSIAACLLTAEQQQTSLLFSLSFHLSITGRVRFPPTVLAWQLDPQTKEHHAALAWSHAAFYKAHVHICNKTHARTRIESHRHTRSHNQTDEWTPTRYTAVCRCLCVYKQCQDFFFLR